MAVQPNRILIQYGELTLKGRNRRDFERRLSNNVQHHLARAGFEWPVRTLHQRTVVEIPQSELHRIDEAMQRVGEVAGIATIAAAIFVPAAETRQLDGVLELDAVRSIVRELAAAAYRPDATFAIRVNRADKRVPLKSNALARELGGVVFEGTDWNKVNLTRPDSTFYVDIYEEGMYCYSDKRKGIGGLPVGSSGRVLGLLSGGIDSPVAAYLLAKRGCRVDFIHLTATRVQQTRAADELVAKIAQQLSRYTGHSRLHLIPYTHFDLAIMGSGTGYDVVLFRRFLARVAERLAGQVGAQALVSGDSLGQVASQTLENLVSTSRAATIPFLRPLIGSDKQEIIEIARRIGTYELSIQPYKDCCALLSENPRTRSYDDELTAIEARYMPNYAQLIDDTLAEAVCLEFDSGERVV